MRVVLHIGSPKTGTTAIQEALYQQRQRLLSSGILYPLTGLVAGDGYGHRHKKLTHRYQNKESRWRKLNEEIEDARAAVTLISCEGFWKYPERAPDLRARFADHDVKIVAGLRRQDRFLASWYLQRVRDGAPGNAKELLTERASSFHYLSLLEQWSAAFGAEAVSAFLYPEGGDVVPLFLSTCGLPPQMVEPTSRPNPSSEDWTPHSVLGGFAEEVVALFAPENEEVSRRYGLAAF